MTCSGSPLWTIEAAERQGVAKEPRSLWDRVESHLRLQEVHTAAAKRSQKDAKNKSRLSMLSGASFGKHYRAIDYVYTWFCGFSFSIP